MDFVYNSPMFRSFIGYEELFKEVERTLLNKDNGSYPPFNVWSLSESEKEKDIAETTYIELAVAGFKKSELQVNLENQVLAVRGQKQNSNPVNGYRGIAKRDFVRQFRVGEKYVVHSAKLEDGILTIRLDLPMSKKLETRIEIQ